MNEFLKKAVEDTKKLAPTHWDTLLGERSDGSQWGQPFIEEYFFSLPWEEAGHELPSSVKMEGCRYFKLKNARAYFPDCRVGAVRLEDLSSLERDELYICEGKHGRYLGILRGDLLRSEINKDEEAWLIVGKEEGAYLIVTAFPGPPMLPCPEDITDDLPMETAVKVGSRLKIELLP